MFELVSPGKSGSFLFFTSDMSFLVKTISNEEKENFVPANYFHHMNQNRDSLLNRIVLFASLTRLQHSVVQSPSSFGDYAKKIFLDGNDTIHFVVLENIIPPHRNPIELYDLKVQ
jgi:1-phosphatidylinositol-4-phosphate 5-kinase